MGEIQPCPGESDGGDQAETGTKSREQKEHGAAQKWEEARAEAEQARWGQIGQASQRPLCPHPSPQAVESRGSGLRDSPAPCSPRAQEFHQPREGGPASASVQVGSHWTRNYSSSSVPHPHPSRWAGPRPPPLPHPLLGWHGVCQALAENKPAGVGLQGAG